MFRENTTRWKGGMVVLGNREKVVRGLKKEESSLISG